MSKQAAVFIFAALLCLLGRAERARGDGEVFVDALLGDDALDGRTSQMINNMTGPVRTLARGIERIQGGETLVLVNRGQVFTGEFSLIGPRCSGVHGKTFVIEGNNTILDGSAPVPTSAWHPVRPQLWRFEPRRKGTYQLLLNDRPVREMACAPGAPQLPELPPETWCAWRGSIYFQATNDPWKSPRDLELRYAAESVGLTLLDVHDVIIRNVTIRHFRQDGINAHDRCQNIILENVRLQNNGRAGISAGGNSLVGLRDCQSTGNRIAQVMVSERSQVELLKTVLDPRQPYRMNGGTLFIDGQLATGLPAR